MSDIQAKISFVLELEKLKGVLRKTKPVGLDRYENSAEHSWQTALTALIFLNDAPDDIDALKVLKMMLIHDVVEIDAGDVLVYDTKARKDAEVTEQAAAKRIFGLLPEPLATEMLDLWHEFEARQTPEARFAKAMDRVNPVLQNLAQQGQSWVENGIGRDRVVAMNSQIEGGSAPLWAELEKQLYEVDFFGEEVVGDDRLELPTSSV